MNQKIFWSDDALQHNPYRGGMYVRSDLGSTFKKWTDKGIKIVGIAIDDSNEIEFIVEMNEEE